MGMRIVWVLTTLVAVSAVACHSTNDPAQRGDSGEARLVFDAGQATAVAPDGAAQCTPGICNYQTQQGCAAGYMCHPRIGADQQVTPVCEPAGNGGAGDSCTWLSCQPGYICAADGRCRHMCCGGDWSACQTSEGCTGAVDLLEYGSSVPVSAGVSICEPTDDCDVFDPSSCPAGQGCYIIDSRGGLGCLPLGTADAYEICSPTQLCKAGLTCVAAATGTGQCRRLCRAVSGGGAPVCPPNEGMICAHYVNDPPGVGECVASIE